MADEIIDELWRIKDNIAHEYDYSIDALVDYLKSPVFLDNQRVVDLHAIKMVNQNINEKHDQ